jgi:hypothetical protein
VADKAVPQSVQNAWPATVSAPQLGQLDGKPVPQAPQKRALGAAGVAQAGQTVIAVSDFGIVRWQVVNSSFVTQCDQLLNCTLSMRKYRPAGEPRKDWRR